MDTPPPEHPVPGTLLLQFSGGPTLTVAVSLIAVYTALVPWSLSRHRGCNECWPLFFLNWGIFFVVTTHGSWASIVSGKDTVERQEMPSPESYLGLAAAS